MGLSDESYSHGSVEFQVFVDGSTAPSGTITVPLGQAHALNIDVSNVLRLRLTVAPADSSYATSSGNCGLQTAVWGNARIAQ